MADRLQPLVLSSELTNLQRLPLMLQEIKASLYFLEVVSYVKILGGGKFEYNRV